MPSIMFVSFYVQEQCESEVALSSPQVSSSSPQVSGVVSLKMTYLFIHWSALHVYVACCMCAAQLSPQTILGYTCSNVISIFYHCSCVIYTVHVQLYACTACTVHIKFDVNLVFSLIQEVIGQGPGHLAKVFTVY